MGAGNILSRVPKWFIKTVTFTTLGDGEVGALTIGTVTGRVLLTHLSAYCTTLLEEDAGTATVELGVAGDATSTATLIAQTTATAIDANEVWRDSGPEVRVAPANTDFIVGGDIILTVGSQAVSAGVIEFVFLWLPISADGNIG